MIDAEVQSWTFTASDIPPGPNDRLHWAARRRLCRPLCDEIAWQVRAARPPCLARAKVHFTLIRAGGRERDPDNSYATIKPLLDVLKTAGLLVDDSGKHIDLVVTQERGARRGVRIVVEAL